MKTLQDRVLGAKARFTMKTGDWPTEIFLGPKEFMELKELVRSIPGNNPSGAFFDIGTVKEFAGMKVIGLMSDGVRAGNTEGAE